MSRGRRSLFAGALLGASAVALQSGCATSTVAPLEPVRPFDLERFMGDWYVIAAIPTWFERDSYAGLETYTYAPGPDGRPKVDVTFAFRRGGFDAPVKTMKSTGYVAADDPARWEIQFLWPLRLDYRVIHVDPDYRFTVIGREARDFVWVMAREPYVSVADYAKLLDVVKEAGYAPEKLRRVPQPPSQR